MTPHVCLSNREAVTLTAQCLSQEPTGTREWEPRRKGAPQRAFWKHRQRSGQPMRTRGPRAGLIALPREQAQSQARACQLYTHPQGVLSRGTKVSWEAAGWLCSEAPLAGGQGLTPTPRQYKSHEQEPGFLQPSAEVQNPGLELRIHPAPAKCLSSRSRSKSPSRVTSCPSLSEHLKYWGAHYSMGSPFRGPPCVPMHGNPLTLHTQVCMYRRACTHRHAHMYTHILMPHSYSCVHTSQTGVRQIRSSMQTVPLPAHPCSEGLTLDQAVDRA